MARLTFTRGRFAAVVERCMPASLFGRLALLLAVAVLTSHVLALSLMFELHPGPPWADKGLPPPPEAGMHPMGPPKGLPPAGILLDIGVRLSALLLAAWIGARWLSDPVHRLATAARELGHNIHRAPLVEAGTLECREATRVFNQMQQHIRAQLEQRDQFVAAVSHDLRTPLTRLALRAESLSDDAERQRFVRDIAEMDTMIRSTLDFLRGAADAEAWVTLDLHSLVSSLVHDQQECGHEVTLLDRAPGLPACISVRAQTSALRRCIGNLLDNAVRYGGGAQVEVQQIEGHYAVQVLDHGPGIAPDELERVLQPFYRVEASRNRNSGGVGLGLAVASDIARHHGGSIQLSNRTDGVGRGLCAALLLPRPPVA